VLKELQKKLNEPGESHPFSYLGFVVEDRLRELDPTAGYRQGGQGAHPGVRRRRPVARRRGREAPRCRHRNETTQQVRDLIRSGSRAERRMPQIPGSRPPQVNGTSILASLGLRGAVVYAGCGTLEKGTIA